MTDRRQGKQLITTIYDIIHIVKQNYIYTLSSVIFMLREKLEELSLWSTHDQTIS